MAQQPPAPRPAPGAPQRPPQQVAVQPPPPLQPPALQPPPKILSQSPDEPVRPAASPPPPPPPPTVAKIALPTPEELGLAPAKAADTAFDWAGLERRLQALRAVGFQMSQTTQGNWKAVCMLPTAQAEKLHRIETEGASRAEAVRLALDQAEKWAERR